MSTVVPQEEPVQIERSNIHHSNADCHDTEKHQQNASTDCIGNVDRDEGNDRLTNENSERMNMSSACGMGSGVQGSSVGQFEELLTNETQQKQPLQHKRLHNLTETQQQPNRHKLLNETETSQTTQEESEGSSCDVNPADPMLTGSQCDSVDFDLIEAAVKLETTSTDDDASSSGCYQISSDGQSNIFTLEVTPIRDQDQTLHKNLYICDICGKEFKQKFNLSKHMSIHTGSKMFHCEVCSKSFRQKNHLTVHMRQHTGEKPYKCNVCEKAFRQKSLLDIHTKKNHS